MTLTAREVAEELEKRLNLRDKYLKDFHAFVVDFWPYATPSGGPIKDAPHIEIICEHLSALQAREIRELVINVPPGTGKSRICSILWHAWLWAQDPQECILFASYNQSLGIEMGEYVLKVIRSDKYQRLFKPRLPRIAPPSDFKLENGGWRLSTTPGGQATGSHATARELDDPIKAEDATKKECENVNRWIDNTWASRQNLFADSKVVDLCVMQRLSENDPAQYLIDKGHQVLVMPFRYVPKKYVEIRKLESGRELLCDWRSQKDEPLIPEITPAYVDSLPPYVYHSQFQQEPTGEGDRVFKPEWLTGRFETPPLANQGIWCISVDAAFKGEPTSDYVVMQVWCKHQSKFYLVDQARGHWDFDETCTQLTRLATKYPQCRAKLIEVKANGDAIISHLGKTMTGLIPRDPEGGKLARASGVSPYLAAGNVLFASKEWTPALIRELEVFPRGRNDDQCDALSQALVWYSEATQFTVATPDVSKALLGLHVPGQQTKDNTSPSYQAWRQARAMPR